MVMVERQRRAQRRVIIEDRGGARVRKPARRMRIAAREHALGIARQRADGVEIMDRVRHDLDARSEEHTSELQSLMRISYAVFCLKKKKLNTTQAETNN